MTTDIKIRPDLTPFGDLATVLYFKGLVAIPLGRPGVDENLKGTKLGQWQALARKRYDPKELVKYATEYRHNNVGLGCGALVGDNLQLVGIDIDIEEMRERAELALPALVSGKRGSKGATWFVLAPKDVDTRRLKDERGANAIEILGNKTQTVLPPSIHPSGKPYEWLGTPLTDVEISTLPAINHGTILELEAIAKGQDVYYNGGQLTGGEEFPGINHLIYGGPEGGGNMHNVRLRFIAHAVSMGWGDTDLIVRVIRAEKRAVEAAGWDYEEVWKNPETELQSMISSAREKDFSVPKPKKQPLEIVFSSYLKAQYEVSFSDGADFWSYDAGHYKRVHRKQLMHDISVGFPGIVTAQKAEAGVSTFMMEKYTADTMPSAPNKVCLKDGTLDMLTGFLHQHSPDDYLPFQLNVTWSPIGGDLDECPLYDYFLPWVFGGDADCMRFFEEFAGLTFNDDMSFEATMWLLGTGANGKSKLTALLQAMHNPDHVSNSPISSLSSSKQLAALEYSYLNVSSEESNFNSVKETIFKAITGGDTIHIERLYQEAKRVKLRTRLMVLTNELPVIPDASPAMERRLNFLTCPNTVSDEERDPLLFEKLMVEKDTIFRRWVKAYVELKKRGRFIKPATSKKLVSDYVGNSTLMSVWIRQRVKLLDTPTGGHCHTHLFTDFGQWCDELGATKQKPPFANFVQKLGSFNIILGDHTLPDGSKAATSNAMVIDNKRRF